MPHCHLSAALPTSANPMAEQLSEQHCCCFENHENVEGFQDLQPYHQQLPIMEKNMSNQHTKSLEQKKTGKKGRVVFGAAGHQPLLQGRTRGFLLYHWQCAEADWVCKSACEEVSSEHPPRTRQGKNTIKAVFFALLIAQQGCRKAF